MYDSAEVAWRMLVLRVQDASSLWFNGYRLENNEGLICRGG